MVIICYNYLFKKQSPIENKQLAINYNILDKWFEFSFPE